MSSRTSEMGMNRVPPHYTVNQAIVGRKAAVREMLYAHKPANILGLKMILKLGCKLIETWFEFSETFESF